MFYSKYCPCGKICRRSEKEKIKKNKKYQNGNCSKCICFGEKMIHTRLHRQICRRRSFFGFDTLQCRNFQYLAWEMPHRCELLHIQNKSLVLKKYRPKHRSERPRDSFFV